MANSIQVTTSQLTKKAEELKGYNAKFKTQVENLQTQEKSLNTMWDGEANDAFHSAFEKDITQMNKFYEAIEKYVQSLNEIIENYKATEEKNLNIAKSRTYKK